MKPYVVLLVAISIVAASPTSPAAGAGGHVSASASHASASAGHMSIGGAKTVSAIAAIPLRAAGAAGVVSGEVGGALWNEANRPLGAPLPIDPTVHTAGPRPDEALRDQRRDAP